MRTVVPAAGWAKLSRASPRQPSTAVVAPVPERPALPVTLPVDAGGGVAAMAGGVVSRRRPGECVCSGGATASDTVMNVLLLRVFQCVCTARLRGWFTTAPRRLGRARAVATRSHLGPVATRGARSWPFPGEWRRWLRLRLHTPASWRRQAHGSAAGSQSGP